MTAPSTRFDLTNSILLADGSYALQVSVAGETAAAVIQGDKTSNAAVPGATNVGALTGLANAAAPSLSEGFLAALSLTLAGQLRVTDRGTSATGARVATSGTVATLQAANVARKEVIIVNESAVVLYVKFGAAATSTDYTVALAANATLIEDKYTGIITGILASSTGFAPTTEVT